MRVWERIVTWISAHPIASDAVWVLPLAVASGMRTPRKFFLLWTVGLVLPIMWRRIAPVRVLIIVLAGLLSQALVGPTHLVWTNVAILVALYTVVATSTRPVWIMAVLATVLTTIATPVAWAQRSGDALYTLMLPMVASVLVAATLGLLVATYRAQQRHHAKHHAREELEHRQQLDLATVNERNRIAREMHDIVAHSLSVIIAQADGGRYAATHTPAAATHALETIADTGRVALADMRRLLGVLRTSDEEERTPQPRSIDIEDLVTSVRDAGVKVSVIRTGTERFLPPCAGLTVYRICPEALTNVLKHAGPSVAVTLGMFWRAAGLDLVITDDGRGAAATGESGHGLVGMRERVATFGGTLFAGPRPGGGFEVKVFIPLPPQPKESE